MRNEDYYAYGQPVLAPADGTVITVVDGLPDNQPQIETNEQHLAGNHVVIQTGESEFVFLAHLQPGSRSVWSVTPATVPNRISIFIFRISRKCL